jgi:transposase
MIGAIALDGLRGLMTLESGTTNDVFEMFVSDALVPNLHPGDIVVMDNLSSHKQPRVKALIEAKECSVLFTPPYSPEFNPIEEAWAKLKDILRRMNTATREAFDSALDEALTAITSSDLLGWFEHAGYRFEST